MKKVFALLFVSMFALGMMTIGCGDDDKGNACADVEEAVMSAVDGACADYDACTTCDTFMETYEEQAGTCDEATAKQCMDDLEACGITTIGDTIKMACDIEASMN